MAAVNLSRGQCDYCQDTILVVIDKVTRALVWRLEPGGMSRHKEERRALRTFRLFPDDPILTLVFRFDSIGCQDCGAGQIEEYWLRPRLTAESSLVFDTIWKGTVEFGDSGQPNGSGPLRENSASLTSLWPRRAYRLRRSVPAGWLPNPGSQRDPMTTDCRNLGTDAQTAGQYAQWARRATAIIKRMSDTVDAGPLLHLDANNVEHRLLLIPGENKNFMVGWSPEASGGLFEKTKKLVASWDS